jgi:putative FmdB family regulatory protein
MALYEYRCLDCNTKYDVLHLGKESESDIVCPQCQSKEYKKLLSVFSASAQSGSEQSVPAPSCATGACGLGGGCFS